MKILAIASRIPAAEKKGDQIVSFFRLMYLAKSHEIQLVCFGNELNNDERNAKLILENAGITVHIIPWRKSEAAFQLMIAILNSKMPFQCALFKSNAFQGKISTLLAEFKPELVYCVLIRAFPNLKNWNGRLLVDLVDSMALNFKRRISTARGIKKWLFEIEFHRLKHFENYISNVAERLFVVSNIDRIEISSNRVEAIPLGIDMFRFHKDENKSESPTVAFTGNMSYSPNVEAVKWFVENCWNDVNKLLPGVKLVIAGSNPSPVLLSLASSYDSIHVMGRVDSIAAILNQSHVAIAPMQSGSGMQFKILEAMACGVPVVTTNLGLGDISAVPDEDILIADTPGDFVGKLIALLKSKEFSDRIGGSGMLYLQKKHSWDALNKHFATVCRLNVAEEVLI